MAKLPKRELLHAFEEAVRESDWNFIALTPSGVHPARYRVFRGDRRHNIKVYIWNLTPGGRNRPLDERRIQPTSVESFQKSRGETLLILGWRLEDEIFAGYDYEKHSGQLGESSSFQIKQGTLDLARINGLAPYKKGSGEIAIAIRPDFMGLYIDQIEGLHGTGEVEAEVDMLTRLTEDPESVNEDEIEATVALSRRHAITTTRRAVRDIRFRTRVLGAYKHRCAFCGLQLRLLDAAHVLPVEHPESTDHTSNGVALCTLHHRAYDRSLVAFDGKYNIVLHEEELSVLAAEKLAGGLSAFRSALRPRILLPDRTADRPPPKLIAKANKVRGWNL
jgi:putative restriction endonuclease